MVARGLSLATMASTVARDEWSRYFNFHQQETVNLTFGTEILVPERGRGAVSNH